MAKFKMALPHTGLKEVKDYMHLNSKTPWYCIYIEINFNRARTARLYIDGNKTNIYADGYGYHKSLVCLIEFVRWYAGVDLKPYGNGIEELNEVYSKIGISIESLCRTKDGFMYKIEHKKQKGITNGKNLNVGLSTN